MAKLQFRVLYREFLFRLVDLELLSADALGDSNKLIGRVAALLMFISIILAMPALFAVGTPSPAALRLFYTWSTEHVLIATTMLAAGIFAVLSWDSTFPDRRDVLVLLPLPLRTRTLFLAKVSAVATALGFTVVLLHAAAGLVWPLALAALQNEAPFSSPALTRLPAVAPASPASLEALLNRDLAPGLSPEMGVSIGVVKQGERRVFAYGRARPDSIYQIGSISKTFTGLLLAQMVMQGKVRLNEPVRDLLPAAIVRKPAGMEITLLDLATHHSGLPPMPNNFARNGRPNPEADYPEYHVPDLYAFLAAHGVARPPKPAFNYSNLGFGLLGQALAERAGMPYTELLARQVTEPLGLRDTVVFLSPEQRGRMIQAYSGEHKPLSPWDLGAFAPAGALYSTAADMLTYLEAQLRAESPAFRLSQALRADVEPGMGIALAWIYSEDTGTFWHNGAVSGYRSYAFFSPRERYAAVVLANEAKSFGAFADLVGQHIRQRLAGEPPVSLASVIIPPSGGFSGLVRMFLAYWTSMLAGGAFILCCVLGIQGIAAQLLPRRMFLRVSSYLQLAAFCIIVLVYLLQPPVATPDSLIAANGRGPLAWLPSYWFLGLFQELNGSPALAPLARRAWIGLAVAVGVAASAYALSYLRTLRKIVEEPDIVPGTRGGPWLPRFGGALETAVAQFSVRTLLRSRLHRLILAFYLGMGFAFLIFVLKTPAAPEQLADAPVGDAWGQAGTSLLAATIAMMGFSVIGTRVIFSIPLDLRANWIFRITAVRRVPECLAASRRSLLLLSAAPVWALCAAFCFRFWPWRAAAGHLAVLALVALIIAELCLHGFNKIPFTCSYLPGKSHVHLVVLGALLLLRLVVWGAGYEHQALEDPARLFPVLVGLACVWACVRWSTVARARSEQAEVQFEEAEPPAVQVLGLSRDGSWPINPQA